MDYDIGGRDSQKLAMAMLKGSSTITLCSIPKTGHLLANVEIKVLFFLSRMAASYP